MTRKEFAEVIAYISAACQASLSPESLRVYFDLLGDLSYEAGQLAAKRVAIEHKYPTFPSVAELRRAAIESTRGEVQELSWPEAWELAWRAIGSIDPEVDGSIQRGLAKLPKVVADTVNAMGVNNLAYGKEPVAVIRAQFRDAFEPIAARHRRSALFTPAIANGLDKIREQQQSIEGPVLRLLDAIGIERVA